MKIVKFLGGLGNQMFQYAFLIALRENTKEDIFVDSTSFANYKKHNGFELRKIFAIQACDATVKQVQYFFKPTGLKLLDKIRYRLLPKIKREKKFYKFYPSYLSVKGEAYFDGYWQNFQYFDRYKAQIRKEFKLKSELDERNQTFLERIASTPGTVSIHVRRGDYLEHPIYKGLCSLDYYKKAIISLRKKVNNLQLFVIFSNDISWCEKHLLDDLQGYEVVFVNWNQGEDSYKDLILMKSCQYNIIANSSFSWWAAYLNDCNEKMVFAPKKWINYPMEYQIQLPDWILID